MNAWIKQHRMTLPTILKICMVVVVLLFLSACGDNNTNEMQVSVENCWQCTMYKVIFESVNQLTVQLYDTLVPKAMALLGVAILFWLAFRTGKMLVTLYEPDINEYIQSVKTVLFKAMLVSAVLLAGDKYICFLSDILQVPMLAISYFSSALLQNSIGEMEVSLPSKFIQVPQATCQVFTEEVALYLQYMVYQIYVALQAGMMFGWNLFMSTHFVCSVMGLFVVLPTFFLLSLIFPLMFADSFIRLGASIILSPFFFVLWVFPATKDKVKKLWDAAFGSMITMMIGCIYITLAINVMQIFQENSESLKGILSQARQLADPSLELAMRRMATEAVSFMVLIFIILKFHTAVPDVAGYLGGESAKSQVVSFFGGIKQLAISAMMIAVGVAMSACGIPGGDRLIKAGAQRAKEQMQDGIKNIGSDSAGSADAAGGAGVGAAAKDTYHAGKDKKDGEDSTGGEGSGSGGGDAKGGGDSGSGGDTGGGDAKGGGDSGSGGEDKK